MIYSMSPRRTHIYIYIIGGVEKTFHSNNCNKKKEEEKEKELVIMLF